MTDELIPRKRVIQEVEHEIQFLAEHTQRQYRPHIGNYLDFVGANRDWRDREVLYNYMEKLKKDGASQSHINYLIRGPIGAMFRSFGLRLPVKLPKFKGVVLDLNYKKKFTDEEVATMIASVRAGEDALLAGIMALSSIFGLRAGEIQRLNKQDFKPKKKTLMIYTLKGGIPQEHNVPDELVDYLADYGFPYIAERTLFGMMHDICAYAEIQRPPRKAFHAVRYAVINGMLANDIPKDKVEQFMRWKHSGTLGSYILPDAKHIAELDAFVYARHPYLPMWRE